MQDVPIYVINLLARRDRRELMEKAQKDLGLEFTFVSAVNGRDPDEIVHEGIPVGRLTGRPRSRVDYAVVASHRKCWEALLASKHAYSIVLEDDVVIAEDFAALTNPGWIPHGADIVKLETILRYVEVHDLRWNNAINRRIGRLESLHLGAAGYVIGRSAAELLLRITQIPFDPVDHILFTKSIWKEANLQVYQLDPAPIVQGMYHTEYWSRFWAASSIQEDRDSRDIIIDIEAHRRAGGSGRNTLRKIVRLRTVMHAARLLRSLAHRGSYKRIQFG